MSRYRVEVDTISMEEAQEQIQAEFGESIISDSCARTIATWWTRANPEFGEAPGILGELAFGGSCDPSEVGQAATTILVKLGPARGVHQKASARALQRLKQWADVRFAEISGRNLTIASIAVSDMVGRFVANSHGREFMIMDVRYDFDMDAVMFMLVEASKLGESPTVGDQSGITSLRGWTLL